MIFMGEEAGARVPFLYFTDHHDALADSVRDGRRNEFAKFPEFADPQTRAQIPDPNVPQTYERSRPDFDGPDSTAWRMLYRDLLHLRHARIVPHLDGAASTGAQAIGEEAVIARWRLANGTMLTLACNLGGDTVAADLPQATPIWGNADASQLAAFTTVAWIVP